MKIAVTGTSGKLGSIILKELKKQVENKNLRALARNINSIEQDDVPKFPADYDKPHELDEAFRGCTHAILISSNAEPNKRLIQHFNVIDSAKKAGIKRFVYSSIIGHPLYTSFADVVKSNRATEEYLINSGMEWVIGRNGLYIDADLEYLDKYFELGKIINSAGSGKCAYTSRDELAVAYSNIILNNKLKGNIFNLTSMNISQRQLAEYINIVYDTNLKYEYIHPKEFKDNRIKDLGELYGNIIGGIYESINKGYFEVESDFSIAAGREHKDYLKIIREYKESQT